MPAAAPRCDGPSQDLGEDDDGVEDDALSFGSDAPVSMEGCSRAGGASVALDTPRSPERQDGEEGGEEGGEEAEARAEQERRVEDRRIAEMERRHRMELQRLADEHHRKLEEERRRDRQLKEQAPLSEEKFNDALDAILQAITREREHAGKGASTPWKNFKVQREAVVGAFTEDDVGKSLTIAGGVVTVNGISRAVLWGKQVPPKVSGAEILSVEGRVGGRLEVQGAGMLRENPMSGLVAQVLAYMGKVKAQVGPTPKPLSLAFTLTLRMALTLRS